MSNNPPVFWFSIFFRIRFCCVYFNICVLDNSGNLFLILVADDLLLCWFTVYLGFICFSIKRVFTELIFFMVLLRLSHGIIEQVSFAFLKWCIAFCLCVSWVIHNRRLKQNLSHDQWFNFLNHFNLQAACSYKVFIKQPVTRRAKNKFPCDQIPYKPLWNYGWRWRSIPYQLLFRF